MGKRLELCAQRNMFTEQYEKVWMQNEHGSGNERGSLTYLIRWSRLPMHLLQRKNHTHTHRRVARSCLVFAIHLLLLLCAVRNCFNLRNCSITCILLHTNICLFAICTVLPGRWKAEGKKTIENLYALDMRIQERYIPMGSGIPPAQHYTHYVHLRHLFYFIYYNFIEN